jgi:tyrosine-protein phosphatase SIW14
MRTFSLVAVFIFSFSSPTFPFWQSSVLPAVSSPLIGQKISLPGIPNAGKISDSLFRGAQPDVSHLDELKKIGITTIVDLRSESSGTREREKIMAESLGMHFISIPVDGFSNPTSAQLAEFFTLFRQTPLQKIFVHCQYGKDRTGVFIASYRIAFDHWTANQAMKEMLAFGFNRGWHPSMAAFINDLSERLNSDPTLRAALGTGSPKP